MLPYLEQTSLYNAIDFSYPPDTPGMGGVVAFMPAYSHPSGINFDACRTAVSLFICPSDLGINDPWRSQNNYAANQGGWLCDRGDSNALPTDNSPGEVQTGVFYYLSRVKNRDVRDGLSNTVFFSEKIRGQGTPNPISDMFIIPHQTSLEGTYNACSNLNKLTATPLTSKWGYSWVMGENCCTQYNHVSTPNKNTCGGTGFPGSMTNMAMQVSASSRHAQGVQTLMGDASVRYTNDSIQLTVWRALGSRANAENVTVEE